MGHGLEHRRDGADAHRGSDGAPGAAPGKRALTDKLVRRATRKNPVMQRKLGFSPAAYSSAPVESEAFAQDVADKQAAHQLQVDGVVGPATHKAVVGVDLFDFLDGGGTHGGKHVGKRGAGPGPGKGRKLQGDFVLLDQPDRTAVLTTSFGADEGVTAATTFVLLGPDGRPVPGVELTVAAVNSKSTVLRCNRPLAVLPEGAFFEATMPPPREQELHGDGSIGDDDGSRLEA